ncbi:hypothetical protein SASPL_157055 [Salvia splendens]|uniref:Alpha/beta hydrolase fold-3 domain-containing protein n=1 Tax=Salvia splendens TaxID=180675 RepID=A0A8X8VVJ8_SALSN|nr:probable carboxylesterase 2 [Salvia splendens]KAG6383200.1 hypothetical protein SASPL_157055 [Salvia splendens]
MDKILDELFPSIAVGKYVASPSLDPARIYLPPNADPTKKLPLLVYYHGGGFIVESAFPPLYHKHLNRLVTQANVVAVSVNYRLAPEFPLPIAFEDSWRALKWIAEGEEEWINEFADLKSVYLGGDSAGGNIAHNIAMRVGESGGFQFGRDVPELPRLWIRLDAKRLRSSRSGWISDGD